mgnify:CR=1 FL=1
MKKKKKKKKMTALVMGGFWTIQKIIPIITTVLNYTVVSSGLWSFLNRKHKLQTDQTDFIKQM